MNQDSSLQKITALDITEGAGVQVRRALGIPALRHYDPFLMFDHFGSDDPEDYVAGFPEHPHRGFVTLTYLLDGHLEHRDSMGHHSDLQAGGVQWMKAASGVIHAEMPGQTAGLLRGFQLWINLPAAEKMSDPLYLEFPAAAVPVVGEGMHQVRVIAGNWSGTQGPIADTLTGLSYFDISLVAGGQLSVQAEPWQQGFLYVFEGQALVAGMRVQVGELLTLPKVGQCPLETATGCRFLMISGRPLGEPVAQQGPFVMNTRAEIEQAFADYRAGRLVRPRSQ